MAMRSSRSVGGVSLAPPDNPVPPYDESLDLISSGLEVIVRAAALHWCAFLSPLDAGAWRIVAAAGAGAPSPGSSLSQREPSAAAGGPSRTKGAARSSLIWVPVTEGGDQQAMLCGQPADAAPDAARAASGALQALSAHLAALATRWAAVIRASARDPVTGVLTQAALERRLDEEVERARRYGGGLSLLLCDLEQLRALTDAVGRRTADLVLRSVGEALRGHLRQMDVVGRYGGDAFLVVLPETRADEALQAGARLAGFASEAVGSLQLSRQGRADSPSPPTPRLRIGASTYPSPAHSAEELIDQAEEALREARHSGDAEWLRHWLDSLNEPLSAGYSCVCRHCGRIFLVDDRAQQRARRFCSHECYIQARRAEEQQRNQSIRELRARGESIRSIARRFDLSHERIRQICLRVI